SASDRRVMSCEARGVVFPPPRANKVQFFGKVEIPKHAARLFETALFARKERGNGLGFHADDRIGDVERDDGDPAGLERGKDAPCIGGKARRQKRIVGTGFLKHCGMALRGGVAPHLPYLSVQSNIVIAARMAAMRPPQKMRRRTSFTRV